MTVGGADGGNEGVGAAVVTGVDASPVLELSERVLDPVALAVEYCVVSDRDLAVALWRDAGGDALSARAARNQSAS